VHQLYYSTLSSVIDLGSSVVWGNQTVRGLRIVTTNVLHLKINRLKCSCVLCVRVNNIICCCYISGYSCAERKVVHVVVGKKTPLCRHMWLLQRRYKEPYPHCQGQSCSHLPRTGLLAFPLSRRVPPPPHPHSCVLSSAFGFKNSLLGLLL
jgi:hypothetical protein